MTDNIPGHCRPDRKLRSVGNKVQPAEVSGLRSQVSGLRSDHNQSYQVIQNVNSWVLIVVGRRMGVFSDKSTY